MIPKGIVCQWYKDHRNTKENGELPERNEKDHRWRKGMKTGILDGHLGVVMCKNHHAVELSWTDI